jgi:hypothetical protein
MLSRDSEGNVIPFHYSSLHLCVIDYALAMIDKGGYGGKWEPRAPTRGEDGSSIIPEDCICEDQLPPSKDQIEDYEIQWDFAYSVAHKWDGIKRMRDMTPPVWERWESVCPKEEPEIQWSSVYHCDACGLEVEIDNSVGDRLLPPRKNWTCPDCSNPFMRIKTCED